MHILALGLFFIFVVLVLLCVGFLILLVRLIRWLAQQASATRMAWRAAARRSATARVRRIAEQHGDALGQRWLETVRIGSYGDTITDAWLPECDDFLQRQVTPQLDSQERNWLDWQSRRTIVGNIAEARAAALRRRAVVPRKIQSEAPASSAVPSLAYDEWCAAVLRRDGWHALPLQAADDDRGIDVIAENQGFRVVLQCRRHEQRIGEAVVEQAAAGRQVFEAGRAAVVCPESYTQAAQRLAASLGVLLLHESQLPDLARLCGIGQAPAFIPPPPSPTASHPS